MANSQTTTVTVEVYSLVEVFYYSYQLQCSGLAVESAVSMYASLIMKLTTQRLAEKGLCTKLEASLAEHLSSKGAV